ncbi:MAG: septation protein IspZ [Cardiobacteriaceae bacterium]|nr:septation protein IspZ [Cardiobacteriaceae bacterium]
MQDFFPAAAFIAAYVIVRISGGTGETAIFTATAAIMIACLLQVLWKLFRREEIEKKLWLICAAIWILGGITLLLHDDLFIKLKPTVLNIAIAAVFLLYGGKSKDGKETENLTKKMLGSALDMPEKNWKKLNLCWVGFFLFEAALNVVMAFMLKSNDAYIAFKFWGLMALSFVFILAQLFFLRKYLRSEITDAAVKEKGGEK